MRVIVSFYRFLVAAFFLLATASFAFMVGLSISSMDGTVTDIFGGFGILAAVGLFVFLVLLVGITATFISMHDRLCDLVQAVENRREEPYIPAEQVYREVG